MRSSSIFLQLAAVMILCLTVTGQQQQPRPLGNLKATATIQAESCNFNFGTKPLNGLVESIDKDDYIGFSEVNLGNGTLEVAVYYKCCSKPEDGAKGSVDVYFKGMSDDVNKLATITFEYTGGSIVPGIQPIANITGKQDIYLKFNSDFNAVTAGRFDYYVAIIDYIVFY